LGKWFINTEFIREWMLGLDARSYGHVAAALFLLEAEGPQLGRPFVDSIKGSRFKNMKELRPASAGRSELRILFVFDPERRAIMLIAGDKSGIWVKWYKTSIARADTLYERYLRRREEERS
jgi:hypothetical protein